MGKSDGRRYKLSSSAWQYEEYCLEEVAASALAVVAAALAAAKAKAKAEAIAVISPAAAAPPLIAVTS